MQRTEMFSRWITRIISLYVMSLSLPLLSVVDSMDTFVSLGLLQFPCYQCHKAYRHKTSLTKHLKYECGKEAQFRCEFCPYRAKQKANMNVHVMIKHGNPQL
ncbi:hypothetical protein J6590_014775 [Homalodisca vitripennis]|nr:hypothetical protein J6590_014775 [Homalodisca vitripennis]